MRFSFITSLIFVFCSLSLLACVHQKEISADGNNVQILQASVQRTLPGRQEAQIIKQYGIILKWLQAAKPEAFFFYCQDAFWICDVQKAHYNQATKQYATEKIRFDEIKKGDTLQITTIRKEIPAESLTKFQQENSLAYKTENAGWSSVQVSDIVQKPDILMP